MFGSTSDDVNEFYHLDYDGVMIIYTRGEKFDDYAKFIEKQKDEAIRKYQEMYKNYERS